MIPLRAWAHPCARGAQGWVVERVLVGGFLHLGEAMARGKRDLQFVFPIDGRFAAGERAETCPKVKKILVRRILVAFSQFCYEVQTVRKINTDIKGMLIIFGLDDNTSIILMFSIGCRESQAVW
jgi:hypothetical protein